MSLALGFPAGGALVAGGNSKARASGAVWGRTRGASGMARSSAPGAPADVVLEAHVLQGQEETARRRMELRAEMAAMRQKQQQAEAAVWWEVDCPPNMVDVDSPAELASAIAAATSEGRLAVVNYFSPECYACRSMQPKLRQIARESAARGVVFLKVNGFKDGLREHCEALGITRIPYFHFHTAAGLACEFTANMSPPALKRLRRELELHSGGAAAAASAEEVAATAASA